MSWKPASLKLYLNPFNTPRSLLQRTSPGKPNSGNDVQEKGISTALIQTYKKKKKGYEGKSNNKQRIYEDHSLENCCNGSDKKIINILPWTTTKNLNDLIASMMEDHKVKIQELRKEMVKQESKQAEIEEKSNVITVRTKLEKHKEKNSVRNIENKHGKNKRKQIERIT